MKGKFEHIVSAVIVNDDGLFYTARMSRDADNRLAHNYERHFIGGEIRNGETPEDAIIKRVKEKTRMDIELLEALTCLLRTEVLANNGGTRTVITYWFIAKVTESCVEDGTNTSGDIEQGRWDKFDTLCRPGVGGNGFADVAWARTPMDLLMRTFRC